MNSPQEFYADQFNSQDWPQCQVYNSTAKSDAWVAARPLAPTCNGKLLYRAKLAWLVFTGRADALRWHNQ